MKKELEEVIALRFRIKELKSLQYEKKSDEKEFLTSVKGVLKVLTEAKAIYEINDKLLALRDDVAKSFGFLGTCQTMMKTSDESIRNLLEVSVKGAENALKAKLSDFLEMFPMEKILLIKDLIMDVKIPIQGDHQNANKIFKEDDILNRIKSMMKKLGNDQDTKLEENAAAEQKSAHALATLSGCLVCISSFIAPNNCLENTQPKECIPNVETILNNAINALKHEEHVKESLIDMKSSGVADKKPHFAEQNANLQGILYQIDTDLGDLLKLYSVNLGLSQKLNSPDCDLDLTNLDERLSKTEESEAEKTANFSEPGKIEAPEADYEDGLSDVDENVTRLAPDQAPSFEARRDTELGSAPETETTGFSEPGKIEAPEADYDDGLSDVDENVTRFCEEECDDQVPTPPFRLIKKPTKDYGKVSYEY